MDHVAAPTFSRAYHHDKEHVGAGLACQARQQGHGQGRCAKERGKHAAVAVRFLIRQDPDCVTFAQTRHRFANATGIEPQGCAAGVGAPGNQYRLQRQIAWRAIKVRNGAIAPDNRRHGGLPAAGVRRDQQNAAAGRARVTEYSSGLPVVQSRQGFIPCPAPQPGHLGRVTARCHQAATRECGSFLVRHRRERKCQVNLGKPPGTQAQRPGQPATGGSDSAVKSKRQSSERSNGVLRQRGLHSVVIQRPACIRWSADRRGALLWHHPRCCTTRA